MRKMKRTKRTGHKRRTVRSKGKFNKSKSTTHKHKLVVAKLVKQRKKLVGEAVRTGKLKLNKTNRLWKAKFNALKRQFARKLAEAILLAAKQAVMRVVQGEQAKIVARAHAVQASVTRFETQLLRKLGKKFGVTAGGTGGKKFHKTGKKTKARHGKKRFIAKVYTHPAAKRHHRIRRAA